MNKGEATMKDAEASIERATMSDPLGEMARRDWPLGMIGVRMLWPSVVVGSALALYELETALLVRARLKSGMKYLQGDGRNAAHATHAIETPAAITGSETVPSSYERQLKIHQTTAEQLVTFVPSMFAMSVFISPKWASLIGGVWLLARVACNFGHQLGIDRLAHAVTIAANWVLLFGSGGQMLRCALSDLNATTPEIGDDGLRGYSRGARSLRAADDVQMSK